MSAARYDIEATNELAAANVEAAKATEGAGRTRKTRKWTSSRTKYARLAASDAAPAQKLRGIGAAIKACFRHGCGLFSCVLFTACGIFFVLNYDTQAAPSASFIVGDVPFEAKSTGARLN